MDPLAAIPSASPLPEACDVLVIGAGPAGSACAQLLARAGKAVCLVDAQSFPREKICGDGLIPDAHAAFARLGVADQIQAYAHKVPFLRCVGPRGGSIEIPGHLATLARRELDMILLEAARRAGAAFHAPWRFEALLHADGPDRPATGARLKGPDGRLCEVRASRVVLATGAVTQGLLAADLCERRTPSAIALRAHVRCQSLVDRIRGLELVWHQKLRPGYGWIFPMKDSVFNIGVGLFQTDAEAAPNLRQVFNAFLEAYEPARLLMQDGEVLGDVKREASGWALKGAPLRCSLGGAKWSAPGVLVTGEAAGATYHFTGEGIGKAMETGMLAAEALLVAEDEGVQRAAYEARLRALQPRFALYEKANLINSHPWLADLLIWRGRHSAFLRGRMAKILDETSNPGSLVTVRGLARAMIGV
ncbi:NAD(P)/FAD-dependent oxidoreductase [Ideonella azotifigens]|uniref:Geranylgeranyl reductase family protein n=1 Tax=Ideonella azotifigens TaxID=513160 RepID=A0ABN1JM34_9BURK|nr:NAD(P)/FAD-dependent oxidoreductase [Ideonella azotifigens]MCD2339791.1 NAD(P)/FAD-dependent oxidoreductase [Ideonella azotifigens]